MKPDIHQVTIKTSRPISRFETWLSRNCEANWDIHLVGISDDLLQKTYSIHFESADDAANFRNSLRDRLKARRPSVPGAIAANVHAGQGAHIAR